MMKKFNKLFQGIDYILMMVLFLGALVIDYQARGEVVFNSVFLVPVLYILLKITIREYLVMIKEVMKGVKK